MRDAFKTQAAADVGRFVDAPPVRSDFGFLPWNGAGVAAVGQNTFGKSGEKFADIGKSWGKQNHVEFFAQVRSRAHDRVRNVRIWHAGFFEREAKPAFVLRAGPGMEDRDARHGEVMACHGGYRWAANDDDAELARVLLQPRLQIGRVALQRNQERTCNELSVD